eukprot:5430633-Prorocentrum_lima.AAC.1
MAQSSEHCCPIRMKIGLQTQSQPGPCVNDSLSGVERPVSWMIPIHIHGKKGSPYFMKGFSFL